MISPRAPLIKQLGLRGDSERSEDAHLTGLPKAGQETHLFRSESISSPRAVQGLALRGRTDTKHRGQVLLCGRAPRSSATASLGRAPVTGYLSQR